MIQITDDGRIKWRLSGEVDPASVIYVCEDLKAVLLQQQRRSGVIDTIGMPDLKLKRA